MASCRVQRLSAEWTSVTDKQVRYTDGPR